MNIFLLLALFYSSCYGEKCGDFECYLFGEIRSYISAKKNVTLRTRPVM